ncbi:MAG: ABC transporter permease subunit [Clostridiales bacterium]|nr:ABC transporter permease subunit [Clostridiales bacterium]
MIGLRSKRIASDLAIYLILTVMVVIWLFPIVWLILRAFDGANKGMASATVFPTKYTVENFKLLFTDSNYPYGQWMLNTFIIALGSCVISTLLVLMVSYALSRLRFSMRKKLMNIALILGLFPGFMSLICLYYMFKGVGLAANQENPRIGLLGLTLAYSLASGTGYYIVKGFFDTIPLAIDEAARIDGATKNRIFWTMIIPLSKPIIIYTILTSFISPWCDFIMASIFVREKEVYTIAVGIRRWVMEDTLQVTMFTRFCAAGVLISVPIVLLFLVMQKFYVAGITGGAAKG